MVIGILVGLLIAGLAATIFSIMVYKAYKVQVMASEMLLNDTIKHLEESEEARVIYEQMLVDLTAELDSLRTEKLNGWGIPDEL